ncbi:MAG: type II toxin-antitoxin system RelE/ParE family toxin [Chitinophagales bacterium]
MAANKIIWHPVAKIELKEILDFYIWRNKSKSYSEKLLHKINTQINSFLIFPYAAKNTDFEDIQYFTIDNNFIFYKVVENIIYILMVSDARRNPKTILSKLSKRTTE